MAIVGRVLEVWRYPVKSMCGESLPRAGVGPMGIAGDRGWALRDEAAGEIRGGKKMPVLMQCAARYDVEPTDGAIPPVTMTLPDGTTLRSGDADAAERLSALTGRRLTLWPLQPAERTEHYRRGLPDDPDFETEMRQIFGRLPDEPLPDLSRHSAGAVRVHVAARHVLRPRPDAPAHHRLAGDPRRAALPARASTAGAFGRTC